MSNLQKLFQDSFIFQSTSHVNFQKNREKEKNPKIYMEPQKTLGSQHNSEQNHQCLWTTIPDLKDILHSLSNTNNMALLQKQTCSLME